MSGFGWYTGTVTQGWMMKIFGEDSCGGVAAVNVPTGYTVFAIGLATSATNCVTTTHWVWTPTGLALTTSAMVVDAAEEWKNGGTVAVAASGEDPLMFAIGGMNNNASFGLGVWGYMIWATDAKGIIYTTALTAAAGPLLSSLLLVALTPAVTAA
jgi:hypothetical protein